MLLLALALLIQCILLPGNAYGGRGETLPTYQGVVGGVVQLECPVEVDCPKQAYGWSKSASLAPEAPSATVPSIEKTLSVEVGGARDGGFYSCFSYCRREVVSTVKLEVLPSLAVFPTEVGLHSGETLRLRCSASGFPRPGVVWAAADDVRINLQLRPQLTAEDDVTVQSDMVIKNAHPDMSGSYICAACHSEWNGQCEMTEELQKMFVSVAVYDAVQLAVSTKSREFTRGQEVVLECKVIGDLQLNYWVFWRYNGSRIDEQTAVAYQLEVTGSPPVYTLRILQANESHEGVYWCVAGSTFRAEEASDTVELSLASSVELLPVYTIAVSAVCGGLLFPLCGYMWQRGFRSRSRETFGTQTQQTPEPDPARRTGSRNRMSLETFARKHSMEFFRPT